MMKPAVTNPAFRRLRYALTLASCLLTFVTFAQPTPDISGETAVCQSGDYTYSTLNTGNTFTWSVSSGGIITQDYGSSITVSWFGPQNSTQWVLLTETEPGQGGQSGSDQIVVFIKNNILACNNHVNTSLDQDGLAMFEPDMLLEGNYNTYDGFTVELSLPNGTQLGNTLDCAHIGLDVIGKVTDECTGNACWSTILVEDKTAPLWDCPVDPVQIPCDTDIDLYPHPAVTDNCDIDPYVSQIGLQVDNSDICVGVTITRTWVATDNYDNESTCTQVLEISPSDQMVDFPDDVYLLCPQYNMWPNMTNPTAITGNPATTGAGVPVANEGPYCIYSVVNQDDTLSNCGNTFKIVRTWLVLNWCTGEIITEDYNGDDNEQIIKILDLNEPDIIVSPNITINITEATGSPLTCTSQDLLPPPSYYLDDCGDVEIRIFTPVGEVEYVNGVDGKQGGYVPNPGLHLGNHIVTYQAIDDCGNVKEVLRNITVSDNEPPTTVCDEITDVNLNEQGVAIVPADIFDDGSHDNCCIQNMVIKRMGEPDFNFAPTITFDCNDAEEMVVVRVYDCYDNYNECMVTAMVNDKMNPTCVPPQQKIIPCIQLPADIDDDYVHGLGEAFSYDNCNSTVAELPYDINIDNCGEGHIIRYFQAIDDAGNLSLNNCEQHIYITPQSDWLISFPQNWSGNCGDSISAPEIEVGSFACDMFAVSVEDQYFGLSNDSACFKIVRTWKVINWCNYDPDLDPIMVPTDEFGVDVDEDDYGNFGSYEYQQIIKVIDDTPPALSYPYNNEFCTEDDDCATGNAYIPLVIEGECTSDFEIVHHIDLNNNGTYEINGLGFFEGILPIGNHRILYIVMDGCHNEAEMTIEFAVVDCKKPTAVCSNGLIVELMQTGMVDICAQQFDEYSFDNCPGPLKFSFSDDISDECRTFDCFDGGQNSIQIWVTDLAGNQDYCETFVVIQDNMFSCTGDPITGAITTAQNQPLESVNVMLNSDMDPESAVTDVAGIFEFPTVEHDHDYTITPEKDDEHLNGVTTFDLVLISKHILNIQPLDTPYKMIAADANNSKSITTFDLVELRKLVLFIYPELPNNTSWRFVKKDYLFPDPQNPWAEEFPEVINVNNFDQAISDADFIAVKIGDVNGTATTSDDDFGGGILGDRSEGTLMFNVDDRWVEAGETVQVVFQAMDFNEVYGFQFTIDFDLQTLDFQSIVPTSLTNAENYGLALTDEGAITALWYETEMVSIADGEEVLALEFTATAAGNLNEMLNISSRFTEAEAYIGEDMVTFDVGLDFGAGVSSASDQFAEGYVLFQNVPNPFTNRTVIGFELPEANKAKVTIFDTAGRIIWVTENQYPAGYNEVTVNAKDLPANAALFYKIEADGFSAVKQMTVVK